MNWRVTRKMEPFDPKGLIGIGGIPFIQALVAAFKTMFPTFPAQYLIGVAISFGMVLNAALAYFMHLPYWEAILVGIVAGLMASGAYTAGKRASRD